MPDYDDALVEAVAKAIALDTMGWVPDAPVKLDSRIYIDEDAFIEPARIARAAIAAVLEWQGWAHDMNAPTIGDVRTFPNGRFTWDGRHWLKVSIG